MARRWESLSQGYRERLESAGRRGALNGLPLTASETRAFYEQGGDLRGGRGSHPRERPRRGRNAAPLQATEMMSIGNEDEVQAAAIRRWRRTLSPAWIPRSRAQLGDDTAAALSQFHHPRTWSRIEIEPAAGGHFTMTVFYRGNAYPASVLISDWSAVQDISYLVNDNTRLSMATSYDRRRLRDAWKGARFRVTITGTDPKSQTVPQIGPRRPGQRRAVPRRRAA